MPPDLDERVDALYGLPLERFIAERDALARELRAESRREEAQEVAALAKPSVAAWAVNQVVRSQADAARELWEAGDAILAAQEAIVNGDGSGEDLRTAVGAERAALVPLASAARGLMTGAGRFLGEAQLQAVNETLHAAAVDPAAREPVAAGRSARPLRLAGLQATPAGATPRGPAPVRRPAGRGAARAKDAGPRNPEADARAAAEAQAEEARRAARKAAQQRLARAEHDRDVARSRIAAAVGEREQAALDVVTAREALERTEAALDAAEERLAARHGELERAEDAVDHARAELRDA